jgi:hypothetical protein
MIGLFRSRSEILPLQAEELGLAGAAISDRASLFDARPAPPSGSRRRGRICLPVDAAHAEVFDLEEFLDAVFRASRPMPLSFMPPNGAISVEMIPSLMPTMPYSSPSATHQMWPMSRL